jgi:hypothetical protein
MAREMRLVDPLTTMNNPHPSNISITDRLAGEYNSNIGGILESKYPDSMKVPAYNDALMRYNSLTQPKTEVGVSRDRKLQQTTQQNLTNIDKEIVSTVPKHLTHKAKRLLSRLKASGIISYDDQGRVTINNKQLDNANIVDLVYSAISTKRNLGKPEGWGEFSNIIQESGIPKNILGPLSKGVSYSVLPKSKTQKPKKRRRITKQDDDIYNSNLPGLNMGGVSKKRKAPTKITKRSYDTRSAVGKIPQRWELIKQ